MLKPVVLKVENGPVAVQSDMIKSVTYSQEERATYVWVSDRDEPFIDPRPFDEVMQAIQDADNCDKLVIAHNVWVRTPYVSLYVFDDEMTALVRLERNSAYWAVIAKSGTVIPSNRQSRDGAWVYAFSRSDAERESLEYAVELRKPNTYTPV